MSRVSREAFIAFLLFDCLMQTSCSSQAVDSAHSSVNESVGVVESRTAAQLSSVSSFQLEKGSNAPLRDEPAATNFRELRDTFRAGQKLQTPLAVYDLEAPGDAMAIANTRALSLGLKGSPGTLHRGKVDVALIPSARDPFVSVEDGNKEVRINALSGSERFVNHALFHKEDGIASSLSDGEYVDLARRHLMGVGTDGGTTADVALLHPYKVRRYMNAGSDNGQRWPETVYQVAVAFNSSIDGLPVVGPGSKFALHMTVDGQMVSSETSVRRLGKSRGYVNVDGLISPDDAQTQVQDRLRATGIDMTQYRMARAEFGYLRLGRSSVQNVVSPHYMFVFEPLAGATGKKLAEAVSAVKDPSLRAIIDADARADQTRKSQLLDREDAPLRR